MATYAPVPAFAERKRHPRALILIVAGHAALLAAVMAAKMDVAQRFIPTVTDVTLIPLPPDPPKQPPPDRPAQQQPRSSIDRPVVVVPVPAPPDTPLVDTSPIPVPDPGPLVGPGTQPTPQPKPQPLARTGPRFATPESQIRPPYPASKIARDEEASLRLRLHIDAAGRVTAVEAAGSVDPVFFAAARRHIIARWRYEPATEGGRAIASSTVITLQFKLDD